MGAAFVTFGKAFVDAVSIGLVGHDEDTTVGGSGRSGGEQEGTGKECGRKSHGKTPAGEGTAPELGPKC